MATEPVRIDKEEKERIGEYHEETDAENQSETATEVVRAGLRELQGPVSQQWRQIALSAAFHLTLVAVLLVIVGFGTRILTPGRGTALAMVTMTVALAPVAGLELIRLVRGQSSMGQYVGGEEV